MRVAWGARVLASATLLVAPAGALVGCGTTTRADVQAKVEQFVHATAGKDYKTLCQQVLAESLLEHLAAGGIPCERAMQIALGGVQSPTLAIGRIIVNGDNASAITLTSARGQEGSLDAIELVKGPQGWRVASLGAPVIPRSAHR